MTDMARTYAASERWMRIRARRRTHLILIICATTTTLTLAALIVGCVALAVGVTE